MTTMKKSNSTSLKSFSKFCLILSLLVFIPISSCTEKDSTNIETEVPLTEIDTNTVFVADIDTLIEEVIVENNISKANKIIAQLDSTTSLGKKIIEIQKEIYPDPAKYDHIFKGSQIEINIGMEQKYIDRKILLAKVIETIKEDNKTNDSYRESRGKSFISNLDKSQDLWYKYMRSQILVKYPEDSYSRDVSAFNLCYFEYLIELTDQRIVMLNNWLIGEVSGKMCSGTIENKR